MLMVTAWRAFIESFRSESRSSMYVDVCSALWLFCLDEKN